MSFKRIIVAAGLVLAASAVMAESAPKAVDLDKLYGRFEKAGYSSLELIDSTKGGLLSGVVLAVGESLDGGSILNVGTQANGRELARLSAADDAQENKLKAMHPGAKVKAICDLAFSSGTKYMAFEGCVFK